MGLRKRQRCGLRLAGLQVPVYRTAVFHAIECENPLRMACPEENPVGADTILSESAEVAGEMLHWGWNRLGMLGQPFDL